MKNIGNIAPESILEKKKRELRELQASMTNIGRQTLSQERARGLGLEEVSDERGLFDSLHERDQY